MNYFWLNRFNGIEKGGPFKTAKQAKVDAVKTYRAIQDGFAFDIAINKGNGELVAEGFIKNCSWRDGEFSETEAERAKRLRAA